MRNLDAIESVTLYSRMSLKSMSCGIVGKVNFMSKWVIQLTMLQSSW